LSSAPSVLTAVGDTLLFRANDGIHGHELWRTDGTEGGTALVADIAPGDPSSFLYAATASSGRIFFVADDWSNGTELWTSDGTTAGTFMVLDIFPGVNGSYPSGLVHTRGGLYFAANDGVTGHELWVTDGTSAGTHLVQDSAPGPMAGGPDFPTVAGLRLIWSGDHPDTGRELWALDLPNQAPTANAGPDQSVASGTPVTLNGSASSDPDGDPLTFEWRGPGGTLVGTTAVVDLGVLPAGSHEYTLTVSDGGAATSDTVVITVEDVPVPLSLSVDDAEVLEGDHGQSDLRFTVRLSRPSSGIVAVAFRTLEGTAKEPQDFLHTIGGLAFAPGQTVKTLKVKVRGDRRPEPNETFIVRLGPAVGAGLARSQAIGTILNDD
jgi:ELWxxDGT repeat protein